MKRSHCLQPYHIDFQTADYEYFYAWQAVVDRYKSDSEGKTLADYIQKLKKLYMLKYNRQA